MRESALRAHETRAVPFDYAALTAMPGWRDGLAWPVDVTVVRTALHGRQRAFLQFLDRLTNGNERRIATLAGGRALATISALIEAALAVQGEAATGVRLEGGPPEIAWLRGEGPDAPPATPQRLGQPERPVNMPLLRRIARMREWTPLHRMPAALLAPAAVAVTHNAMLRQAAARDGRAIGFRHAQLLFPASAPPAETEAVTTLSREAAALLGDIQGLQPTIAARLLRLAEPKVTDLFAQAARDLAMLASAGNLPRELWTGSGGYYQARALGLEVLRRGGKVVRFDHGGSTGMIDMPEPLAMRELSVSSRFVVTTEGAAELCRMLDGARRNAEDRVVELVGGAGDPHFDQALRLPPKPGNGRTVYATGAIYGFRQVIPPVLRDPVYIDWQLRLAAELCRIDPDIVLRPHPEGIFRGKPHPLEAIKSTATTPFETLMAESDVFVFDYPLSTAFWTAVCSDRPIVFIDLGLAPFHPRVIPLLAERCEVVRARYDASNIPRVEPDALADALRRAKRATPDPAPFQRLLAGAV